MIEDCHNHELDLILVKSVSRFSRDTVDALETTRELKRLGIPVYFDLESINSFQPDFELYYSVCAAVARGWRSGAQQGGMPGPLAWSPYHPWSGAPSPRLERRRAKRASRSWSP